MTIVLRPATCADIPALHQLVESAYRGERAREGWTHEADLLGGQRTDRETLTAMIGTRGTRIVLALEGATLVGCVAVTPGHAQETAHLGMLAVRPGRQGGGLGRRLIAVAEDRARHGGARAMEMTVIRQRPELIAWYERCGYRRTGEERPFPADDPRFGVPRRDDLAFVVLAKPLEITQS